MPRRENVKCVSNQYDGVCLSAGKQYVGGVQRPRAMKRVPLMRFSPVWHPKGGKGDLFVVFLQLHISISMGRPCPRGGGGGVHRTACLFFSKQNFPTFKWSVALARARRPHANITLLSKTFGSCRETTTSPSSFSKLKVTILFPNDGSEVKGQRLGVRMKVKRRNSTFIRR